MSKREVGQLNGGNEIEGPRTKRRREAADTMSDVDITHSNPANSGREEIGESIGGKRDAVRDLGLKLWQTVKDAVNKEGRALSSNFLRRPPKRQYPDYYQVIQRPIALEDIKKQLDNGDYATFEAVRQEFELCFTNAKQYNMKESDIWRDAKDLLKLVNKTYNKLSPADNDGENVDGERKNKGRGPNLTRLIKSRLQKLVDKTDDTGRILSKEFMELPSKKEWPIYYKQIMQPQCLENIFKRIKRKEYPTSSEFAADVELVFTNAMTFNQEHTGIWEDAKSLQEYFRTLISDLPAPYALPNAAAPKHKIKIKPPLFPPSTSSNALPAVHPSTSTSHILRIPVAKQVKVSPVSTPAPPVEAAKATTPAASSNSASPTKQTVQQPPLSAPQPISYLNTTFSHYPNASYIPPVSTPTVPTTTISNIPTSTAQSHSASNSPAPPLNPSHQLKTVLLTVGPHGRTLYLDYQDGVKCWALKLLHGEAVVSVSQVTFQGDEEEESSDGEEEEEAEVKLEEEQQQQPEVEGPTRSGRRRGKARGRARPKGTTRSATKAKIIKKKNQKMGPIQVKLNGNAVKEQEGELPRWIVSPAVGSNVLEVGESAGLVWKVYIQRMGDL